MLHFLPFHSLLLLRTENKKRQEIFIIVTTTDDYQYKLIFFAFLMYQFTPNLSLLMNNSEKIWWAWYSPLQYSYMYLGCDLSHSFVSVLFSFFIRFITMKLIHLLYVMWCRFMNIDYKAWAKWCAFLLRIGYKNRNIARYRIQLCFSILIHLQFLIDIFWFHEQIVQMKWIILVEWRAVKKRKYSEGHKISMLKIKMIIWLRRRPLWLDRKSVV